MLNDLILGPSPKSDQIDAMGNFDVQTGWFKH